MATESLAVELGRVGASLDALADEVRTLSGHVSEQNGRVRRIEARCAAHDQMTINDTKRVSACDGWREHVDSAIADLRESRVAVRTTTATIIQAVGFVGIVLTLVLTIWQTTLAHQAAHPATTVQHQGK
jgi:hypothetical protein